jgi:hypothetical protein
VTIGREKKRKIRAALHQESLKLLNPQQRSELCGTLAYINSVEPDFIDRLKRIFGERLIEDLKSDARTSTNIAGGLGDLGDVP